MSGVTLWRSEVDPLVIENETLPTTATAAFISPRDPRWRAFLRRVRHDVYHLPEYLIFAGKHEEGLPLAFFAAREESSLLIPLLVRKLPRRLDAPFRWCDLTSPYGYPAPLVSRGSDPKHLHAFLGRFRVLARKIGAVTAFLRFHPLLDFPLEALRSHGDLVRHGETVFIDLSKPEALHLKEMRRNHREGLQRLEALGFVAVMDDWSYWKGFIAAYRQTMNRRNAAQGYCYTEAYFNDFRAMMGEGLHLCTVLSPTGELAAAGLVTSRCGLVEIHLAATADDYLRSAPSKMMFEAVRTWARANKEDMVHLGGGVGCRNDSLLRFKSGFSKERAVFFTFRMVFDEERHASLLRRWEEGGGTMGDDPLFFPRYRRFE